MVTLEKPLRIDIPVRLTELRIAFSIADLAFEGDLRHRFFICNSSRMTSPTGKSKPRSLRSFTQTPVT